MTGSDFGQALQKAGDKVLTTQQTMEEFAESTGGKAYTNRNDIGNAVRLSIANGSAFYELAYHPEREEADGKFHKIQVKVDVPGATLQYHRGYFAVKESASNAKTKLSDLDLDALFNPDVPGANSVIFDAKITPTSTTNLRLAVEFLVDARSLTAERLPDGTVRFDADFHLVVIDPTGRFTTRKDTRVISNISPRNSDHVQQSGLPYRIDLDLPPGEYQMRLAVRDSQSGSLGSIDVPLSLQTPTERVVMH